MYPDILFGRRSMRSDPNCAKALDELTPLYLQREASEQVVDVLPPPRAAVAAGTAAVHLASHQQQVA